jgi:hypothetical protein
VTRFITLGPIFSDLSPLELRIFHKKYYFYYNFLAHLSMLRVSF